MTGALQHRRVRAARLALDAQASSSHAGAVGDPRARRYGVRMSRRIDPAPVSSFDAGVRVSVILFLLLLLGCSSDEEPTRPSTTAAAPGEAAALPPGLPATPYPGAGVDCPSKAPSPLSIGQSIEALQAHGFTVAEVEDSCGVQSISAVISNTANGRAPVVLRREGIVSCFLLVEPRPAVPAVIQGDTTATSAERTLANLHCRLYGPEAGGFTAHVRRLDLAFSELKRRVDVVDD